MLKYTIKHIKFSSNRIVFIGKSFVIKIPIFIRGILANYIEYQNYIKYGDIVAKTEFHYLYNKQERLYNTIEFPLTEKNMVPKEIKYLVPYRIYSRIQVGQDKKGVWKFFDYEDTKFFLFSEEKRKQIEEIVKNE